jgi:ubiquinol-cytochrome c reductase iron-sulfur subunit
MSRRDLEPRDPATTTDRFRPLWVGGWLLVGVVGVVIVVLLWFGGASVEVTAAGGALVALAVAIALHHVVVTRDGGEMSASRPDTSECDLPQLVERRHVLGAGAVAAVGGLLALLGLRRWAPVPPEGSAWFAGSPLLTLDGRALRPEDIPLGGVVTVWPEGAVGTERAAVMVIRLRDLPVEPTRLDGVVDDTLVAYSRLCTHAGCAVALYRDVDQALFCPCHQATFDARRAAIPTSGPASVALPQLPLGLGDDGSLVATGDLTARPGPVGGTVRR